MGTIFSESNHFIDFFDKIHSAKSVFTLAHQSDDNILLVNFSDSDVVVWMFLNAYEKDSNILGIVMQSLHSYVELQGRIKVPPKEFENFEAFKTSMLNWMEDMKNFLND
jgi:hypothetical protein